MTINDYIKILREEFYAAINLKTGWGKEELKLEFERSVTNSLATVVDRMRDGQ